MIPVLVMIQGDEPGRSWRLEETRVTTIGRSSRNTIELPSPSISRFHCELSYINGLWHIADLNSKTGTYVNSARLSQRGVLRPGDLVRLSTNVFRFDMVDQEQAGAEAVLAISKEGPVAGLAARYEAEALIGHVRKRARDIGVREEPEPVARRRVVLSAAVLVAAAAAAALVVSATLSYGHWRVRVTEARREALAEEAGSMLAAALALADAGPDGRKEAMAALREVAESFEGLPESVAAAERYRRIEGDFFEHEMRALRSLEAAGRYGEAYYRAGDLERMLADQTLRQMAATQRGYAEQLAGAAYGHVSESAEQALRSGRREEALAIYRDAVERLGTPAVEARARERIDQIVRGAAPSGAPESRSQPAPAPPPPLQSAEERPGEEASNGLIFKPPVKPEDN